MARLFFFLFLLFSSLLHLHAQDPSFEWANRTGGILHSEGRSIATDSDDNIITVGRFSGSIDLDPGADVLNVAGTLGENIYLQKLDINGNLIWAKHILGGRPNKLVVDHFNNIYVVGQFIDTVDFNPGPNIFNLISTGITHNGFILKLNSSGDFQWAKQINSSLGSRVLDIAIDPSGNVLTTGKFTGLVDFDLGTGVSYLNGTNILNCFIYKLNTNGDFMWAKELSEGTIGMSGNVGNAIGVDSNSNVYTSGRFYGSPDFDPGEDSTILQATNGYTFIHKLDSNGLFSWVKQYGSSLTNLSSIKVTPSGSIYSIGHFSDISDFDPDPSVHDLNSGFYQDIYILKLSNQGNFNWVKQFTSSLTAHGVSITLDENNNVYNTGNFRGTADFNPGSDVYNLTSNGHFDVYVSKLDSNGHFVWAQQMGSTTEEKTYSITLNSLGDIFTTGYFTGTVDFDPTTGSHPLSAMGYNDAFIQKLSPCYSTVITPNVLSLPPASATCNLTPNIQPYATDGCNNLITGQANVSFPITDPSIEEIIWTYTNPHGNSITQNQTINWIPLDVSLSVIADTISANNSNATYQWLRCNEDFSIIQGAINQTYISPIQGYYAVEITENGCIDTSACVLVSNIGIQETNIESSFRLYPNPSKGHVVLEFNTQQNKAELIVTNVYGQILSKTNLEAVTTTAFRLNQPSGLYFITVITENTKKTLELIIE